CYTYERDPGCFRKRMAAIERATPAEVREAGRRWLARGDYTLTVKPYPDYKNAEQGALDRSTGVPMAQSFPDLTFPALERGKLKNGIPVVLARRERAPVLDFVLQFDAGYSTDV